MGSPGSRCGNDLGEIPHTLGVPDPLGLLLPAESAITFLNIHFNVCNNSLKVALMLKYKIKKLLSQSSRCRHAESAGKVFTIRWTISGLLRPVNNDHCKAKTKCILGKNIFNYF